MSRRRHRGSGPRRSRRAVRGIMRGVEVNVAMRGEPRDQSLDERRDMTLDRARPELEKELEGRVHPDEVLDRERADLEALRIAPPGGIVVEEAIEIPALACESHPAAGGSICAIQIAADVGEGRPPGGAEPLLRAERDEVDRRAGEIKHTGPEPLDGIDGEPDPARAAGRPDGIEIDPLPGPEGDPAQRDPLHAGIGRDALEDRGLIHRPSRHRDAAHR